ncbi:MAG: GH25 family lysozyme [Eubacteriales bacterium]|nr:GH25 family lysozyme [Eubacteriales bacterium]
MTRATPERVIAQAKQWIGYVEKKSNKDLDDFTANAGKNNYTRFNRDYKQFMNSGTLNMQWCAAFVSCVFAYEFGLAATKRLLCRTLHCYTPTGARYFREAGRYTKRAQADPRPGDVVFFYSVSKGRIGHVGIVTRVDAASIYTIEGNTGGGSSLVTNGGAVLAKSYKKTSTYIDGYGRPLYDEVEVEADADALSYALGDRALKKGGAGEDVRELQSILIGWGYDLGGYGADGDFGAKTEAAVSNFQCANHLTADGIYDALTHKVLMEQLGREVELPVAEGEIVEQEPPEGADEASQEPEPENDPEPTGEEDPAKDPDRYVLVTGSTVNVRTQPNTGGRIVFVAGKGDQLAYAGMTTADGWHGVVCEGALCWISGRYSKVVEIADDGPGALPELPGIVDDDRAIVDISAYQTIKDAAAAAKMAKHVKLVIHRASVGSNPDKKWPKHVKLMREAGSAYGTYHYVKATTAAEAVQEARLFWRQASPYDPRFYVADMEYSGIDKGHARGICSAFLGELKRLGARKTGIYVGHHLYKLWDLNYAEADFVWIPRYGNKAANLAGKPGKWPAYPCTLHQYSSGGSVPGIIGRIDMNRMTGKGLSFEHLIK